MQMESPEPLHPRVSRARLESETVFVKRPWPNPNGLKYLLQEIDLQRHASTICAPHGSPALPIEQFNNEEMVLACRALPDKDRFDLQVTEEYPNKSTLNKAFRIGEQLAAIHEDNFDSYKASPEKPALLPIPIAEFQFIPESTLLLFRKLPDSLSKLINRLTVGPILGNGFIHGDFKPDNVFAGNKNITVIDWERAGQGELAHDLASFIATVLSLRIGAIALEHAGKSREARIGLMKATAGTWRLTASFLRGYGIILPDQHGYSRLAAMVGVKLLARAQAVAYAGSPNSPAVSASLAVVKRLILEPESAGQELRKLVKTKSTW